MTLQRTVIGESLVLSSVNTDKFKTATLTISFSMPLDRRDYLLGLVLAGVMRRGSRRFPSIAQINRRLDILYASTVDIQSSIRGDVLCFNIAAELLSQHLSLDKTDISDGVLDVISDILFYPLSTDGVFPTETVESEKTFIRESLAAESNDTGLYAGTRLKELMCRQDALQFPTLEYMLGAIDSITAEELSAYHERLLASPVSAFYVGCEDEASIAAKLEKHFSALCKNPTVSFPLPRAHGVCTMQRVCEDRAVNQGKLCLGFRTGAVIGDESWAAAVMLNEIFGASPASKLFLGVRERLGLCYYCYSSYSMLTGNMTVGSGIDVKNRDTVADAILSALAEIRRSEISDTEFVAAQKSLEYSYIQMYDSPISLSSFYSVRKLFGVSQTIDECRAAMLAVTREQVASLAKKVELDTYFFLNGTLAGGESNE